MEATIRLICQTGSGIRSTQKSRYSPANYDQNKIRLKAGSSAPQYCILPSTSEWSMRITMGGLVHFALRTDRSRESFQEVLLKRVILRDWKGGSSEPVPGSGRKAPLLRTVLFVQV